MEGLPILTCLIQHTLRGLCTCNSSNSSDTASTKWVYAVFWKILPRNYPPPKWDYAGSVLDQAKGNKRNWILVWEDGFCDLHECQQRGNGYLKGRFGADVFFKLSHEVYNYGEGLIGKVAADNSHKWVFKDSSNEHDPSFISSWNASLDPQPRAWGFQFNSGIQTIAIISVREGIIQLGSFDKILEDLNLVISIQRKFSYLHTIPGIYTIQRPFFTVQHGYNTLKHNKIFCDGAKGSNEAFGGEEDNKAQQLIGSKRTMINVFDTQFQPGRGPTKSINLGYNGPQDGLIVYHNPPHWPIPPLLPHSNFRSLDPVWNNDDTIPQFVRDGISGVIDLGQELKPGFTSVQESKENDVRSKVIAFTS